MQVNQVLICPTHPDGKMWYLSDGWYQCSQCSFKLRLTSTPTVVDGEEMLNVRIEGEKK